MKSFFLNNIKENLQTNEKIAINIDNSFKLKKMNK